MAKVLIGLLHTRQSFFILSHCLRQFKIHGKQLEDWGKALFLQLSFCQSPVSDIVSSLELDSCFYCCAVFFLFM